MLTDTALSALSTLGRAWMQYMSPHDFHGAVSARLTVDDAGRYTCPELPGDGLAQSEALGLTLVHRWAELAEAGADAPLVRRLGPSWSVRLPGQDPDTLGAAEALPLVRALQTCRRIVWPRPLPFQQRDMVLEGLERAARWMDADLRGPIPAPVIAPPVNTARPSDLGRSWR